MALALNAGFTAVNGDTCDATYLNTFVNTGKVTLAADTLIGRSATTAGDWQEVTCTAQGRALLSASTASAQLTALGIGASGTLSGLTLVSSTRYESPVSAISYATSVALNFAINNLQSLALTGNVTFTTSNLAAGRAKQVLIAADTSSRTLSFPSWVWLGSTAPASIAANKSGILSLLSFGTADSSVCATWTVQS